MTMVSDPRQVYRSALEWTLELIKGTTAAQLENPTPCSDWNVRSLVGHAIATVERAAAIGQGVDPFSVPGMKADVTPETAVTCFEEATAGLWSVWQDDELLEKTVTVPWGQVAGKDALNGYAREIVVHGWDLAQATDQPSEAPEEIVHILLAQAQEQMPAEPRGGPIPFDPVIESSPEAGPTERLANWFGHARM